jgi:hypothetical protein
MTAIFRNHVVTAGAELNPMLFADGLYSTTSPAAR